MKAAIRDQLIETLKDRFAKNPRRHPGVEWSAVQAKLLASPRKLQALHEMERTGGEPDVIGRDEETGELVFCDCSPESPTGRRSLCYDREALDSRKENKPSGNAVEMASSMGVELLVLGEFADVGPVIPGIFNRIHPTPGRRRRRPGPCWRRSRRSRWTRWIG